MTKKKIYTYKQCIIKILKLFSNKLFSYQDIYHKILEINLNNKLKKKQPYKTIGVVCKELKKKNIIISNNTNDNYEKFKLNHLNYDAYLDKILLKDKKYYSTRILNNNMYKNLDKFSIFDIYINIKRHKSKYHKYDILELIHDFLEQFVKEKKYSKKPLDDTGVYFYTKIYPIVVSTTKGATYTEDSTSKIFPSTEVSPSPLSKVVSSPKVLSLSEISSNSSNKNLVNEPSKINFKMNYNYIYLLIEREFIKTKENIYKLGRTQRKNLDRFKDYPKYSKLIIQIECDDCIEKENILIWKFQNQFKQRKDIGTEYFEGDKNEMIDLIIKEIRSINNKIIFSNLKKKINEIQKIINSELK